MKTLGDSAEDLALHYLQQQGLRLLQRNFRSRYGEIDLIMRDSNTLVFIEVRLRKNNAFGGAAASITTAKQQKIILTAHYYLQQHGNQACRFDAILIQPNPNKTPDIEWIRQAFEAA